MSYRSEVAFKVEGTPECLAEVLANHSLPAFRELYHATSHLKIGATTIEFYDGWTRWSENAPEVEEINQLLFDVDLREGQPIGVVLLRLGEELSDYEQRYYNWPYVLDRKFLGMGLHREMNLPFDMPT